MCVNVSSNLLVQGMVSKKQKKLAETLYERTEQSQEGDRNIPLAISGSDREAAVPKLAPLSVTGNKRQSEPRSAVRLLNDALMTLTLNDPCSALSLTPVLALSDLAATHAPSCTHSITKR